MVLLFVVPLWFGNDRDYFDIDKDAVIYDNCVRVFYVTIFAICALLGISCVEFHSVYYIPLYFSRDEIDRTGV